MSDSHQHNHDTEEQEMNHHPYGAKEICHAVGISHRQLDYWVLIGVVTPQLERHGVKLFRRFSQQHLATLLRIKELIDEGVVVSRAAERVHREMAVNGRSVPASQSEREPGHDH